MRAQTPLDLEVERGDEAAIGLQRRIGAQPPGGCQHRMGDVGEFLAEGEELVDGAFGDVRWHGPGPSADRWGGIAAQPCSK